MSRYYNETGGIQVFRTATLASFHKCTLAWGLYSSPHYTRNIVLSHPMNTQ